jgi:hypothetical protein
MAGNFALNTAQHPGVNSVVFHGRIGTEYRLTATPVAIADPSDRAAARALTKIGGIKFTVES